jgi:carbon-monoxide dehydrogenase catalytic subunit
LNFEAEPATQQLIAHARSLNLELLWDRRTPCGYAKNGKGGIVGMCCFMCQMGPCSLGKATNKDRGVCGATKEVIATRYLVRRIAGGAAAHVEHARAAAKMLLAVATGKTQEYVIKQPTKLEMIYAGLGCTAEDNNKDKLKGNKAYSVAQKCLEDLNKDEGIPAWLGYKASAERKNTWTQLGIMPTGAGAEICAAEHRTTMGADGDMVNLALAGLRLSLVDGYCGLHMASNLQDVIFGIPALVQSKVNLAVIERQQINLVVNGHEPLLVEKIVAAAKAYNARNPPVRINVLGMCCSGHELLMRHGVPAAGGMVQQELAIATGAVEVMVVDIQCILPNVQRIAENFHTKIITTHPQTKITGALHWPFSIDNAGNLAQQILQEAINNYPRRDSQRIFLPAVAPKEVMVGFSVEQIRALLAKANPSVPLQPLAANIFNNNIRGIVAIVGCVAPMEPLGFLHVNITRRLLAQNILVVGTGCWSHVAGQYGLLAADPLYPGVGSGLKTVLQTLATANGLSALPPCWHMGSCVDNGRIEDLLNALAKYLNVPLHQLPVAASAPEFVTEKAVAIGTWAASLGLFVHLGGQPYVAGSEALVDLLTAGLAGVTQGKFYVDEDAERASTAIIQAINEKRQALGLPV